VASGALPSSDREAGYACAIFLRLMPFHRHVDAGDRERLALHSCGVAFKLSNRFFGALGKYLELTENNHAFLADLLQKAEEAGEDGVVGVSKTVADRYDRLFRWPDRSGLSQGAGGLVFDVHYHIMQDQTSITLRPAVAHLNREASRRRRLLRGCCC
jgi:hypothetical protein